MRVLITGHRGLIGRAVSERLTAAGYAISGFDRRERRDVRKLGQLRRAARHCDAVIHLAAIPHDSAGSPEAIMAVNVIGTWNVLLAAQAAGVQRVIFTSSLQALGIAEGERLPDYAPVDDAHPRRAERPYGLSKRLAEDLCEAFTARTGIPTVVLRPAGVWNDARAAEVAAERAARPELEWTPYWEYGAYVHLEDVVEAIERALSAPLRGHHRLLLCAPQISGSAAALDLLRSLAPGVPVRDAGRWESDPRRALIDCRAATVALGWRPQRVVS